MHYAVFRGEFEHPRGFNRKSGGAVFLDAATYPRLTAFLQRIHSRPAYARALEQGGPYELLR